MADLEVKGADQFVRVAKALKQVGDKELKRELRHAIKVAADPMVDEVREHVAQYLPDNYAAIIARDLKVRQSWRTSGSTGGLRLTGRAKGATRGRHVRLINRGVLRHPVYGDREVWVNQRVRPGFWDEPLTAAKAKPRREIRKAMDAVARKLARKY